MGNASPVSPEFQSILALYDYVLPKERIALTPANPRESAKLLVYNRNEDAITHATFADIGEYLPQNCVLVFNETKVIPARLRAVRSTGGKVEVLFLRTSSEGFTALCNRELAIGERIHLAAGEVLEVLGREGSQYQMQLIATHSLHDVLEQEGEMPIPPYMKDTPLSQQELKEWYQTVFAKNEGSVAAPTASLHFTKALMDSLQEKGIQMAFVTLHVNIGTFAPLTEDQWENKQLHEEWYEMDEATRNVLAAAKKEHRPIIAVGTTVTRALESAARAQSDGLLALNGMTDLFLHEENRPQFVDGIVTNFHVPRSSLLMLVASFIGRNTLFDLYNQAREHGYRFFSFGDGMLVLPKEK